MVRKPLGNMGGGGGGGYEALLGVSGIRDNEIKDWRDLGKKSEIYEILRQDILRFHSSKKPVLKEQEF